MYLVLIQRCKQDNPLTGRARYRVINTLRAGIWARGMKQGVLARNKTFKHITLITNSNFKLGTFINPRKALGV